MGLYTTKNMKMAPFFLMQILFTEHTPAAPWRCRNACVVHAGLASLGVAPGARAMQLRWLTSDRTWRFWWLRSRAIDPYHPVMGFTAWVLRENSAEKHSGGGADEVLRIKQNDRAGTEK